MANLKDIRNRIKSVKSIQQVTKAMKMVAAAKMRRAQENMEQSRPYTARLSSMLDNLINDIDRNLLPELEIRKQVNKKLFVVITGDRGMAGAFNTNVTKIAHKAIDDFGKDNSILICIGKKGYSYFKNRNYNILEYYMDFWSELNFQHAIDINSNIIKQFLNESVDQVQIIYN